MMKPYRIEKLSNKSNSFVLNQIIHIENLSFPKPLGLKSLADDLLNQDVFIYGLFVPEDSTTKDDASEHKVEFSRLAGYHRMQRFYDELHIVQLAIHPLFRRQGFAQILMSLLHKQAVTLGCCKSILEVRESNQPAIRLYQKLGFQILTKRRKYYQDNGEDALMMQRTES